MTGQTFVSSRRSGTPEEIRARAFVKYQSANPFDVLPALRSRYGYSHDSVFDISPTTLDSFFSYDFSKYGLSSEESSKLKNAIFNRLKGLVAGENGKEIKWFSVYLNIRRKEEGKETRGVLCVSSVNIYSDSSVWNNSKTSSGAEYHSGPNAGYATARFLTNTKLVVSLSRETDNAASAVAGFYNRIGIPVAIALEEQNPAKNNRLHVREELNDKISSLTEDVDKLRLQLGDAKHTITALTNVLSERDAEIKEDSVEITARNAEVTAKQEVIDSLHHRILGFRQTLQRVSAILSRASFGNKGDAIKSAQEEIDEIKKTETL